MLSSLTYEGIIIHKKGIVIDANKAFEEITCKSVESIVGINVINLVESKENKKLLLSNMQKETPLPYEIDIVKKDGVKINLEIESKNINFGDNEKGLRVTAIRDITEKKKMINEMVLSKENAENANRMKSVFLAQMSHEIRTPINAMVSMASLLKYDFEKYADEDQLMSFDILDRAGGRIIRTIDLLLNLSEIQTGTYETALEPVDIVSDILSKIIAEKKNIKLTLNSNTFETELIADSYTVEQIFVQLIENALKYTAEGTVKVVIVRDEFNHLVVEIIDTGNGILPEYIPKIFESFTQEDMGYTRKFDGNGIGLTLVKKYCELNNATIEVESTKGVGSTFRVVFNSAKWNKR